MRPFPSRHSSPLAGLEIDGAILTVTEREAAHLEWPLRRGFAGLLWWLAALALVIFFARVFYLNVIHGDRYRILAERNSTRLSVIMAPRGLIYDRAGTPLTRNIPSLTLAVVPADLPREETEQALVLKRAHEWFHLPEAVDPDVLMATLDVNTESVFPIPLKDRLTQDEAFMFYGRAAELPGLVLLRTAEREYPESTIFAPVIGFEGRIETRELAEHQGYLLADSIGKQGLEKSYEEVLRGQHGGNKFAVNALGQAEKDLGLTQPVPGRDLVLSVDAGLQKKIYDMLQNYLEHSGLKRGAVVALDPRDGSVLALVSFPSFDNNLFARGISQDQYQVLSEDPDSPLFNRAVAGEYPPGSTWKPMMAAAALSEGTISQSTQVESRGGISIGRFFFGDWKAHGFTDVRRALAVSSDVFFYAVGGGWGGVPGLGIERMAKYAALFGMGEKTGIDLPGEADGFLPSEAWKKEKFNDRWYVGDDYHAGIGQGFILATPLQLANMTATVANGGTLYRPRVVSQIKNPSGETENRAPEIIRRDFIAPDIIRVVQEGMRQTVTEGTAQSLQDLPVSAAGKTGTAQYGGGEQTHGWFLSFAPYEQPEIALVVLVEGQEEQTYNAVPITKEILQWYFRERQAEPGE